MHSSTASNSTLPNSTEPNFMMFNLLSNQEKLLTLLRNYSSKEQETVTVNLKLTIELLSQGVVTLLENRRVYKVLLPSEDNTNAVDFKESQELSCEKVLLEKNLLVRAINTLCLTEAIIVRDNFSNCLTIITGQEFDSLPDLSSNINLDKRPDNTLTPIIVNKSNISPIRLTEIKQRLAQAAQSSEDKKAEIKQKLNQLIATKKTNQSTDIVKQA